MTQADLFTVATPANPLGLPERVRVLSLWRRWAEGVAAAADDHPQAKEIETRRWPWPYEPGWLAIHASLRADGPIEGRIEPFPTFPAVTPGTLCALVWVVDCRPLVPADLGRALIYREGLYAWELERVHRLRSDVMRGPQKFGSVPRAVVIEALERARRGGQGT